MKKRILFLINNLGIGGAESVFVDQATVFKQLGHDVYFCILNKSDLVPDDIKIKIDSIYFKTLTDFGAYRRIISYVKRNKIDLIYSTLDKANFISRVIKIFHPKCKIVIRESGMAVIKNWKWKMLDIFLNLFTDKIIAVSEEVKKYVFSYQPFYKYKTIVVGNGVKVLLSETEVKKIIYEKNINPIKILNIGSMDNDRKGQAELIKIIAELFHDHYQNIKLILVGDGKLRSSLEKLADDLGFKNIVFTGLLSRNEVKEKYIEADIFILNSKNEGSPNVLLEAMSFGLPVISTPVGGVNKMIDQDKNGYIVDDGSELKSKMKSLLDNTELLHEFGLNSYSKVVNELTLEKKVQILSGIFEEL